MYESKKVTIVVPFYQTQISDFEKIALMQLGKTLVSHPCIAIKPRSLVLPDDIMEFGFTAIESFDDHYFRSVEGYNELMLSDTFYRAFLEYDYILIHQLDAFVFKDELNYWCSLNFDYIGAPWIRRNDYPDLIKSVKSKIQGYFHRRFNLQRNGLPSTLQFDYQVGNGGLSLRRPRVFHDLCIKMKKEISVYVTRREHHFNEDIFWSIEVNRRQKALNIPTYKTALKFSMEMFPGRAFRLNNKKLPFGCHAWDKEEQIDFWRPLFREFGYDI